MAHIGDLTGVHVVLAADPLATAVRLADELGADLAHSPIDVHLALEQRRRAARAERLRAAATEARSLAAELADHDEEGDRDLLRRASGIRDDAAAADPAPALEALHRHTDDVTAAAARLDDARRRLDDARAAVPAVDDADRRALLDIDPHAARAAAASIRTASEDVRDAQRQLGPRPALGPDAASELERASRRLAQARADVDAAGRRLAVRLVQAAGVAFVLLGVSVSRRLPVAIAAVAAALPLVAAILWSLRVTAGDRRRLADAERWAEGIVDRRLGGHVAAAAGTGADPVEVFEQQRARWQARADAVGEADSRLAEAQRRWSVLAGDLDPEKVEEILETADTLRRSDDLVERAAGAVAAAEQELDTARRAWVEAARSAGCGTRSPEEADAILTELAARAARRAQARSALPELEAAERRDAARRRLAELLAGRSLDDIAAGIRADDGNGAGRHRRPLILADPLSGAEAARREALRRQLAETEAACVLVTSLPEAATWGFPVFDAVRDGREAPEAREAQDA